MYVDEIEQAYKLLQNGSSKISVLGVKKCVVFDLNLMFLC